MFYAPPPKKIRHQLPLVRRLPRSGQPLRAITLQRSPRGWRYLLFVFFMEEDSFLGTPPPLFLAQTKVTSTMPTAPLRYPYLRSQGAAGYSVTGAALSWGLAYILLQGCCRNPIQSFTLFLVMSEPPGGTGLGVLQQSGESLQNTVGSPDT